MYRDVHVVVHTEGYPFIRINVPVQLSILQNNNQVEPTCHEINSIKILHYGLEAPRAEEE